MIDKYKLYNNFYYIVIKNTLFISIERIVVVLTLFTDTANKSLKGSYPNVENQKEYKIAIENPKDSLWWKEEQ
ncbi:hypothetical protein BUZ59_09020 [Staphylococcus kloosii]|uniref:Uncharacterized protein n=1 Tax=Staphylococcus kloosii TaxID=29384 RepID=A0ABQ0XJ45_9STAP|nr:hypothetical protein [Staphylococcus kloosii]AVQ36634.1 hypothetical protein C7J89_10890 [Staphylococcus kloosii]PNZ08305.1 hypothetical protein CD136_00650 [Staphylococcus kloosii]PTJ76034.1 hypothetical protein BUZ59_09020 [Staphylococcus kloosii]SUM49728.1 proline betaine transporter [Staphylococcus kloosii]GEP81462.1 hypothetical protein SKL01_06400 [Staphylococcus kloosii]